MFIDQPKRQAQTQNASELEILKEAVRNHGRRVRMVLAQLVDSWKAVEQLEGKTWSSTRTALNSANLNYAAVLTATARTHALEYLEKAGREAVESRDELRRMIIQNTLDDARRPRPDISPVDKLKNCLSSFSPEQRDLIDLYYTRSMSVGEIAAQRTTRTDQIAHALWQIRVACDWLQQAQGPSPDRMVRSLTEDLLNDTLDPDLRAVLASRVVDDFGQNAQLGRQLRLHLMLRALLGPFAHQEIQTVLSSALRPVEYPDTQTPPPVRHSQVRKPIPEGTRSTTNNRRPVSGKQSTKNYHLLMIAAVGLGLIIFAAVLFFGNSVTTVAVDVENSSQQSVVHSSLSANTAEASMPVGLPQAVNQSSSKLPAPVRSGQSLIATTTQPQPLAIPSNTPVTSGNKSGTPPREIIKTMPAAATATTATLAASGIALERIQLVNADTDAVIEGYENLAQEATIRLSSLPTRNLNLLIIAPDDINSISFTLPGCSLAESKVESTRPFSLGGNGDNFRPWTVTPGTYQLSVTACHGLKGKMPKRTTRWSLTFTE